MGCAEHKLMPWGALVHLSLCWSILKAVIVWVPPTDTMTWVRSGLSSSHRAGFPWLLAVQEPWERGACVSPAEGSGGALPEPPEAEQNWAVHVLQGETLEAEQCVFSHWLLLDEANQQSGNYNLSVLKTITLKHSASTGFWYVYWQYMSKVLPFHSEY